MNTVESSTGDTITLPSTVTSLDGWGLGISDTVRNYLEFCEDGSVKWHQVCAKLTLAVDDMNNQENYPGWRKSGVSAIVGSDLNSALQGIDVYGTQINVNTTAYGDDVLFLSASVYGLTQSEWKAQRAGEVLDIIIPYTTEVVEDVTDKLSWDGTLLTETGGTITYRDADGVQVVPIPTTTTYTVSNEEAAQ